MVYRTLLKAIQKMLNSLTLRQQHFLHQRKTCTTRYLHEVPQASRYQMIPAGNFLLIFLLYPHTGNPLSLSSSHAPAINARILNGTSLYSGQITLKNTNSASTISATQMAAYTPFRTFSFLTVTSKRFPYPITIK